MLGLLLAVSLSTTRAEDEEDVTETEETEIEGARGSKRMFCCIIINKYFLFQVFFFLFSSPNLPSC